MRCLLALVLLAVLVVPARAEERRRHRRPQRPDVDVWVPVDPHEHDRLHYYDGEYHNLVPGTVAINGPAYLCDVDGRRFADREAFVAHLRTAHRVHPTEIPDLLVVVEGRVHFIGKPKK